MLVPVSELANPVSEFFIATRGAVKLTAPGTGGWPGRAHMRLKPSPNSSFQRKTLEVLGAEAHVETFTCRHLVSGWQKKKPKKKHRTP